MVEIEDRQCQRTVRHIPHSHTPSWYGIGVSTWCWIGGFVFQSGVGSSYYGSGSRYFLQLLRTGSWCQLKWCFPIILCSVPMFLVPCSLFRSWCCTLCVGSFYSLYHCVRFLVIVLFLVPSEYLQIFLGIPDTGILPDTSVICHDSP